MQMGRVVVELTGFTGAPGVNVIHWATFGHADIDGTDWADFATELEGAYADLADAYATGVTITVPQACHLIDPADGSLLGIVTRDEAPVPAVGTGQDNISRATQMLVQLHTGDIRNNRLVRGRTFIGPMGSELITDAGQIDPATRTAVAALWNTLADPLGNRIGVWSRPSTPTASDGQFSDVTSCTVWALPASLRSRRD